MVIKTRNEVMAAIWNGVLVFRVCLTLAKEGHDEGHELKDISAN